MLHCTIAAALRRRNRGRRLRPAGRGRAAVVARPRARARGRGARARAARRRLHALLPAHRDGLLAERPRDDDLRRMRARSETSPRRAARRRARSGEAIRALELPVGEVIASPFCRTMETGRLMFGRAEPSTVVRGYEGTSSANADYAKLVALLASPPAPGTLRMVTSHGNPVPRDRRAAAPRRGRGGGAQACRRRLRGRGADQARGLARAPRRPGKLRACRTPSQPEAHEVPGFASFHARPFTPASAPCASSVRIAPSAALARSRPERALEREGDRVAVEAPETAPRNRPSISISPATNWNDWRTRSAARRLPCDPHQRPSTRAGTIHRCTWLDFARPIDLSGTASSCDRSAIQSPMSQSCETMRVPGCSARSDGPQLQVHLRQEVHRDHGRGARSVLKRSCSRKLRARVHAGAPGVRRCSSPPAGIDLHAQAAWRRSACAAAITMRPSPEPRSITWSPARTAASSSIACVDVVRRGDEGHVLAERGEQGAGRRRGGGTGQDEQQGKENVKQACKRDSVTPLAGYDDHSSRRRVAAALEPPTRRLGGPRHRLPIWCCSA